MRWGLTPAVDILDEISLPELNVLLISQCDFRHVLKTLARRYRHGICKKIAFYVYENELENVARSLLFTTIALDNQIGIGAKTNNFMDIYGNTLLRQSSFQYLTDAATRLVKIVTNFNYTQNTLPFIYLDKLKYRERDRLENIFKAWSNIDVQYDIVQFWDARLRTGLGTRYDSRSGLFDWDLHMRYRPYGGEALSVMEYNRFRQKGISFFQDNTDPCIPNVTLASFDGKSASPMPGYFGDISTGPYPSFGLDSENKDLLRKVNARMVKSATDISEWNIQQMFYELTHGSAMQWTNDDNGECIAICADDSQNVRARKPILRRLTTMDAFSALPLPGTEIVFLPNSALDDYSKKEQFRNFFDFISVPAHVVSKLPSHWSNLCKPSCNLLVDTAQYVMEFRKDDLIKCKETVDGAMSAFDFQPVGTYDHKLDAFLRYKR